MFHGIAGYCQVIVQGLLIERKHSERVCVLSLSKNVGGVARLSRTYPIQLVKANMVLIDIFTWKHLEPLKLNVQLEYSLSSFSLKHNIGGMDICIVSFLLRVTEILICTRPLWSKKDTSLMVLSECAPFKNAMVECFASSNFVLKERNYGLQAKCNGGLEQNAVILKQNAVIAEQNAK
ncbi:hypothetical protein Tco_0200500 [Tanacetum coccineum]